MRALATAVPVALRPAAAASAAGGLLAVRGVKTTTGIVGLPVDERAREHLTEKLQAVLAALESHGVPADAEYRKAVEKTVRGLAALRAPHELPRRPEAPPCPPCPCLCLNPHLNTPPPPLHLQVRFKLQALSSDASDEEVEAHLQRQASATGAAGTGQFPALPLPPTPALARPQRRCSGVVG